MHDEHFLHILARFVYSHAGQETPTMGYGSTRQPHLFRAKRGASETTV